MRPGLFLSIFVGSLALACGPSAGESDATTDDDGSSGPPSTSAPSAATTGGEPTTGETGDPLESGVTTNEPPETTTATDGPVETTNAPETTGEPPLCQEFPDPATVAEFKVLLDAWPDQSDTDHAIDRVCVIDAVDLDAGMVVTRVTCDVDGTPHAATIEIPAAPEGVVDWQVGQSVALHAVFFMDDFGGNRELHMTREGDPMALLIDGRLYGDFLQVEQIGPIRREIVATCETGEGNRNELRYSLESGAFLSLHSGSRGSLAIDAGHLYAIDLALSGLDQFHNSENSLIRRIQSE